jgi:tetratricopeptide (TPR) repeat protein/predicted Ser/Thr protein kinase
MSEAGRTESFVGEVDAIDQAVADVVAEITERLQAGQDVDVEAYIARCPAAAERIRRLVPALQALEALTPTPAEGGDREGAPLGTLGDFRMIREVGRGGMGVVYEAEQISLGRRVALKVLPFAAALDARQLQRFQNETRVAASLQHEHIVPVYAVGCERDMHFYAMQFIEGRSLAALLAERKVGKDATGEKTPGSERVPFEQVARLGIEAAEALDYAHSMGVVHRDIKPGNLLLDERGRLWVADFGLARLTADTGPTRTGDLLGTLRYMSPEQARAAHGLVDSRSDVYALGATLYELLAGQPVFPGDGRADILRRILTEDPVPLRRLDRSIPVDLETIVFKALAKNPAERYATAQDLADDLQRWLEDRPILARRPPLLQRLARWGRRHRPLVAGAGAALLVGLVVLAGSIGWVARDRAFRSAEITRGIETALEESLSWQRKRLMPEALSPARRALELLAAADVAPALQERVRARLRDLDFLDRLENVRMEPLTLSNTVDADWQQVDARFGELFRDAGLDLAKLSAEEIAGRLAGSTVAVEVAAVLDQWGFVRRKLGGAGDPSEKFLLEVACALDRDGWRTQLREAVPSKDRQALLKAGVEATNRLSPATLLILGAALAEDGHAVGQAEALLREAQRCFPNDFWLNMSLYDRCLLSQPPQLEEAVRFASVAVAIRPGSPAARNALGVALGMKERLDEAIGEFQEAIRLKKDYAQAHCNLGAMLVDKGFWEDAIDASWQAIRLKNEIPEAHYNLGYALDSMGWSDEAIGEYQEAIRLKQDLPEAHNHLGIVLDNMGWWEEAISEYQEAIRLKNDYPTAHYNLGITLTEQGWWQDAIGEFQEAIRLKKDNAQAHNCLGIVLSKMGRLDGAIGEYQEAIRLKKDFPEAHNNLGLALGKKGRLDKAIVEFQEAIRLKNDYPNAHLNLGVALSKMGRLDGAISEYQEAIRLKKDFPEAHYNLGQALRVTGLFAKALACFRRADELGFRPSAQWMRECKRLVELDSKLPAILSGQQQPADAAERIELGWLCYEYKELYAAATRFYGEAFTAKPQLADDLSAQHRYNAARAAALAGCGRGQDVATLNATERTRLRRQAQDWLRAHLEAWSKILRKEGDKVRPEVSKQMDRWLADPDLSGVRDDKALAELPEAERQAWNDLWDQVAQTFQQAQGKGRPRP